MSSINSSTKRRQRNPLAVVLWILAAILGAQLGLSYAVSQGAEPCTCGDTCQCEGCDCDRSNRPLYRYGVPEGTVIDAGRWCMAFDGRTRVPRWTLESFTAAELQRHTKRSGDFRADGRIPREFRPTLADYSTKGFDRGHCAAAANHPLPDDNALTFLLSNVAPQDSSMNRGIWRELEESIRSRAIVENRVWVITCPLWLPANDQVIVRTIGVNRVAVPTHFGKAILEADGAEKGRVSSSAWIIPNAPPADGAKIDDFRVSVDDFEASAGLDLWPKLPDDIETTIEAAK